MLDDITEIDIKKQLLVPDPCDRKGYLEMKSHTPARLGLWRCGTRYKTQAALRFRADHAAAQDAVNSYVSDALISEMNFVAVCTQAKDKEEYITRPDLGRVLGQDAKAIIEKRVSKNQRVQIMVGDGLSSSAIEANIRDVLLSINQGLKTFGLSFKEDEVIFVKHARVRAMDYIGEWTNAEVVVCLIGERPGLATAKSMSAYIAYKPTVNMVEARRTVVSNIHSSGTAPVEAGAYIAEIIKRMLDTKKSGVEFK